MNETLQEILRIQKENNILLREIKGLLLTILNDNDYSQTQDMRAFCINVAANAFMDILSDDEKCNIKNNFKK